MFKDLEILQTASALAKHAASRQSVIAQNIANADTPGYKAKDIEPFKEAFARAARENNENAPMSVHDMKYREIQLKTRGAMSPDGNTVSIEDQMWRAAAAGKDHKTATALYGKVMDMLRTSLGGGR